MHLNRRKSHNRRWLHSILLVCATVVSYQSVAQVPPQDVHWFGKSDLQLNPKLHPYTLDNGMRVVLVPNKKPSHAVAMRLYVRAGALQEQGNVAGVAHYLEHMAFNGSTHVPEGEMIHILERHGLAFGPDTNAETNFEFTEYMLDLPKNDDESIDTALHIFRETASELTLAQGAIDRERPIILAEYRQRNTYGLNEFVRWGKFVYKGAEMYNHLPIGTVESINKINHKELKQFYQQYYRPQNTTLIVSGDFELATMRKKVEQQFASWRNTTPIEYTDMTQPVIEATEPEAQVSIDRNAQTQVGIHYYHAKPQRVDHVAQRLTNIKQLIANNALNHRLDSLSYASNSRFLGASTSSEYTLGVGELNYVTAMTQPGDWRYGLKQLERTIRQVAKYGFSDKEIKRQLESFHRNLKLAANDPNAGTSGGYAHGVSASIKYKRVMLSAKQDLALFDNHTDAFTTKSINHVFGKMYGEGQPRIFVTDSVAKAMGDNAQVTSAKTVLASYQQSLASPVLAYQEHEVGAFAYQDFGQPQSAKLVKTSQYGAIKSYQFANGVVLNVKHTDIEKDTIYINIRMGHGFKSLTAVQAPLVQMFNFGFAAGGLEAHTLNDLRTIFGGKDIGVNMTLAENAINANYVSAPDTIEDQLEVFAAFMTHPAYRTEGKTFADKILNNSWQNLEQSPEGVENANVYPLLYHGDARRGMTKPEDLDKFALSDVAPLVKEATEKGPIEIALVGDITDEQAIKLIGKTFGALDIHVQAPSNKMTPSLPPALVPSKVWYHRGEPNTAVASGYWPLPDGKDFKQGLVYDVMSQVIRLKLNTKVREQVGAVYTPYTSHQQSLTTKDFGFIAMHSNTKVKQVDDVLKMYREIMADIRQGKISEDEMTRALTPILDQLGQREESNRVWMDLAATAYSYPDIVEQQSSIEKDIQSITAKDIQLAAKAIPEKSMMAVKVLPAS